MDRLPLNDSIATSISKLVDDSRVDTKRNPSHYDIQCCFERAGLLHADPKQRGQTVGKAKRVQSVLSWAIDENNEGGERLVYLLLSLVKSVGGFRVDSTNYVGNEAIENLKNSFKSEGYMLSTDGNIDKVILESLTYIEKNEALMAYARRAKRGVEDAALVAGTSKDLMEAVAAHVIQKAWGDYPVQANFPTLLGQAFTILNLATNGTSQANETAQKRLERAIYELACSINKLRNKEGTGHGRPFLSTITDSEAKLAIESIGIISEFLLSKL